jgi:lipoprotein-anchoring transpeptidase ErfK/SrfK
MPVSPASSGSSAAADPCAANPLPHLVLVSVAQQYEWMCAGGRVLYQNAVTTGIPTDDYHTPTGRFVIQAKMTDQTLTLLTGDHYVVHYWIPFDAPLFGFHDASWQTIPYGSARYRTNGSHGCVHMPLAAIAWLYRWAPVGTPVVIT